jgi:hypothetical protein
MKKCSMCKTEKPLDDFYRRARNKDGRNSYCKECGKKHYQNWKDFSPERKKRYHNWKIARVEENRQKFVSVLQESGCVDCGLTDFRVLEFDHIGTDKTSGVATLVGQGAKWERIEEEIAKCEVRCCNCHRIKTAERGKWWTTTPYPSG